MASADPQRFWDARYGEPGLAYGSEPNDFLREQAAQLPTGEALCLAEGEGRNGVYLAERGHRVTVQDLSAVGLAKAEKLAAERGVTLSTSCGDLQDFKPAAESTDLVVAIWMHLPSQLRAAVLARAISALRPGGHLILESYTPRQLALGTGGPPTLDLLVEPEQLRDELAGLELLVLQERQRPIDEGPYHQGMSAVVQAVGRKPDANRT
jgi:SAM-dependent methyltransferase